MKVLETQILKHILKSFNRWEKVSRHGLGISLNPLLAHRTTRNISWIAAKLRSRNYVFQRWSTEISSYPFHSKLFHSKFLFRISIFRKYGVRKFRNYTLGKKKVEPKKLFNEMGTILTYRLLSLFNFDPYFPSFFPHILTSYQ